MSRTLARARRLAAPKEPKGPSFRRFLRDLRDRDDEVGELSRYVLSFKGDLPANRFGAYKEQLEQRGATDAMLRALTVGWGEYKEAGG